MTRNLLLTLLCLILSACASMDASGPQFSKHEAAPKNNALVYLLKPDPASKDGVTTCLALQLNNTDHGCVKGKGYILSEIEPGQYKAALVNKAAFGFKLLEFDLTARAGEVIYLEYAFGRSLNGESLDTRFASLGIVVSGNHVVAKIEEPEALAKLAGLQLSL
jgi:hypothetical protein